LKLQNRYKTEVNNINQRLSAFKQFFPETLALLVLGEDNEVISSAVSGDNLISADDFSNFVLKAVANRLQGEILKLDNLK
jgi:spore coat protein CotF